MYYSKYINIDDLRKVTEVLFVLNAIDECYDKAISKIALQKLLYLSASFSPIKDVVMEIIKFQRIQRGPYNKEVQNLIDHLVAHDYVEIVNFKQLHKNNSLALYKISPVGKQAVQELLKSNKEEEKYWWIKSVIKLSVLYTQQVEFKDDNEFENIDKVLRLVYQDLTFKATKDRQDFGAMIDLGDKKRETFALIEFVKRYIKENSNILRFKDDRQVAELVLIAFFELLFSNYLKEYK